ncbi:universal stress protein [Halobacteriales archaeon QS_1_68_17]|nr:MAG: universal stress protein [Halobacteriales archaeon QS_1_68_17]
MYDKILVPTDGSEVSRRATEHAVDLAEKYGATVTALYVVDIGRLEGMSLDVGGSIERLEDEGEDYVAAVVDAAESAGLDAGSEIRLGKPAEEILEYADEAGVDLIVMGTHGRGGLGRRLLGSVTERVVRLSDVPVHVVNEKAE